MSRNNDSTRKSLTPKKLLKDQAKPGLMCFWMHTQPAFNCFNLIIQKLK